MIGGKENKTRDGRGDIIIIKNNYSKNNKKEGKYYPWRGTIKTVENIRWWGKY
jgi:hypothetical protein